MKDSNLRLHGPKPSVLPSWTNSSEMEYKGFEPLSSYLQGKCFTN